MVTGTWVNVGTTGTVFWGTNDGSPVADNGSWSIVSSVPLPAALPLFLVALGGLGIASRRSKNADSTV